MVRFLGGGLLLLLISVAGCGHAGLVPVTGTVKLDGKPLTGASVLFIAQDASGRNATGFTGAHGVFRLSTFERDDGALPGKYKVVVQLPVAAPSDLPPAATQEEAQQAASSGESKSPLPARFSQVDQTILEQEIPPNGDVVFELQSK